MIHGIDVHTHFIPEQFPAYIGKGKDIPWPSMNHEGCGHAHVMIQGKNYRTVPSTSWAGDQRIVEMDQMGIGRQVVSPMPELLSYWLPADDATVLLRHINDQIAALCNDHTQRFSGLGAVPLQDVDKAVRELEHIMTAQRLLGAEIATHVNGVSIGDARFEPFFAAAEAMGAAIFMHGLRPAGKERLVGPAALEQVVGFPGDVALGIASLITGGMLARHPKLRIGFSHGGGAFSIVLPRLEHGWKNSPPIRDAIPESPTVYAKRCYYDTLVYNPQTLRYVIDTFGADRIMIGTDYPFQIADRDPHGSVQTVPGIDEKTLRMIRDENPRRYLGIA